MIAQSADIQVYISTILARKECKKWDWVQKRLLYSIRAKSAKSC